MSDNSKFESNKVELSKPGFFEKTEDGMTNHMGLPVGSLPYFQSSLREQNTIHVTTSKPKGVVYN